MFSNPGGEFTYKAQEAVMKSQDFARRLNQQQVDALHLLYILVSQEGTLVATLLRKLGIDVEEIKKMIASSINRMPRNQQFANPAQFYLTQDLARVIERAKQEAMKMEDDFISTEHFLLALLDVPSEARNILDKYVSKGLIYDNISKMLEELRGGEKITDPNPETKYQIIEKYTRNLTKVAKLGKLDPVIGRENEIRRVIQVLSRRTKNNPVLIGEAGVGKTAIVEGLAQRIIKGDIPESLKSKEILSLDLGLLIAGTKFRGEFEQRLKSLVKEIEKAHGHYILFIDELHTVIGAGAAEGAIDASNLLKPALARGQLRAIGATTLKEYQKYIEKDPALERRFMPVYVSEPSVEDTISILRGIKEKYELHHGVKIKDSALIAAAELATRYITDRFLPDKAIDLLDEAASSLRLEIESEPIQIEDLKKEIQKYEIEKEALKKETDAKSKQRLVACQRSLADLNEKLKDLDLKWQTEKNLLKTIGELNKQLERMNFEAEMSQREGNLEKVAEIKYSKIPDFLKQKNSSESELTKFRKKHRLLKEEVNEEDIARVVSRWTGIPIMRLIENEAKKLYNMEESIQKRVIGQKEAIKAIANAIRRSRAGISEEDKPTGSFMFLGPTGVGKTETAKALAEFLFNDENTLIRLDMSEYMEKHTVSKMIGSPPGYVGYEEGGQLTELIRRRPYSVLLLDEIEKAHPDVFNILLQILDDARLTDAKGRKVSFKNTIIVMTSNVGSDYISNMAPLGFVTKEQEKKESLKDKVMEALKDRFRPEFINRIDEIIIFNYLTQEEIRKIVDLELNKVTNRLMKNGITFRTTEKAKSLLVKKGFDQNLGARPLKRTIQKLILDPMALKIVSSDMKDGANISVDADDGKMIFKFTKKATKKKRGG
ncbi:MAG: AAA family ATPase [Candidatus Pacebacteria bacterium]|nr:AAA family ATPase [Candidatus Paceibacterota bacterium]